MANNKNKKSLHEYKPLDTPIYNAVANAVPRNPYYVRDTGDVYGQGSIQQSPSVLEYFMNGIQGKLKHERTSPAVVYPAAALAAGSYMLPFIGGMSDAAGVAPFIGTAGSIPYGKVTGIIK